MVVWWLILLSILTYAVIQKSVSAITRTPVWVLWLVMMAPVFLWFGWVALRGQDEPMPMALLFGSFITCPLIYFALIQVGRRSPTSSDPSPSSDASATSLTPEGLSSDGAALAKSAVSTPHRTIDREDEDVLKRCFPWSVYYLKGIEYRAQALICTGHLRTSSDVAYQTISNNIQQKFGQRFLVIFQEGLNGKPFFALVPNPQVAQFAQTQKLYQPVVAAVLLIATILTTIFSGMLLSGVDVEELLPIDPGLTLQGLPYCLALLLILMAYHFGQYFTARFYRLKASLPYFIPVPPVVLGFPFGTFGAFLQVRSPMPNRKALFDMGFVGSIVGLLTALPIVLWGLSQSALVDLTTESGLFNLQSFDPRASFLIALLSKMALSDLDSVHALELHPVAIAGCLGLLIATINLMPVGQLNGGKIVHAMFGQRAGALIGQGVRLLVFLLAYIHRDQREFWILAILFFFMPSVDEPALNDVSELDNRRDFCGVVALALLTSLILPAPPALTHLLF